MEENFDPSRFGFASHREMYERFLIAAKSILLGEPVSDCDRDLVRTLASNDDWINEHNVSPYDFYDIDIDDEDEEEEDAPEDGEDGLDDESDDDDDGFRPGLTKEMREFGVREFLPNREVFSIAKKIWEGKPFIEACRGSWDFDAAIDMVASAKFTSVDDLSRFTNLLANDVERDAGSEQTMKNARWRLADCHYVLGHYEESLQIYERLLESEKGYVARPTLACQVINIKLKTGRHIEAKDLMSLVKPSAFKLTAGEYAQLMSISTDFLNAALDGMIAHGLSLEATFKAASRGNKPFQCFYRSNSVKVFLNDNSIDYTFMNLSPDSRSLNDILSYLFGEMRFLGQQAKDVVGIQDDWVAETKLYNRLREVFPSEKFIHHYRAPWLWKYQLAVYCPKLNLAIDYRGSRVLDSDNYTRQSGGMDEYIRLYDRTIEKAEDKYGIHVKIVTTDTPFSEIISTIRSLGGAPAEKVERAAAQEDGVVICPHCSTELEVPGPLPKGQRLLCPACDTKFMLP